jgi:hypothetical protein
MVSFFLLENNRETPRSFFDMGNIAPSFVWTVASDPRFNVKSNKLAQ